MDTRVNWTPREPSGSLAIVEGLGLVEIYRDNGGHAVDINGQRCWSQWRESERMVQIAMQNKIGLWRKLNEVRSCAR